MKSREQGFTYPLTLAVLILFLIIFSVRVERVLTERKLAHETETILQEEYYFHSSVRKIEKMLQLGEPLQTKGTFPYENGIMAYQAETPTGTVQKVNFTLNMHTGEIFIGRGFFDTKAKKMTKWAEIN